MAQARRPLRSPAPPKLQFETTSAEGAENLIEHAGEIKLAADGSATLELRQRYHGRYAIQLRSMLEQVPKSRRKEIVEARLLGAALPSGRVETLSVTDLDEIDKPVKLTMSVKAPGLARLGNGELELGMPFLARLGRLVELPKRQTPLYISERVATRTRLSLTVVPPPGAKLVNKLASIKTDDPRVQISAADELEKDGSVKVRRSVAVNASRVQPDEYAAFREEVERGDSALNRRLRFKLP